MIGEEVYSPVEQIHDPLFTSREVQVFIKRDDLIHPFISGNKWRKLKYLLQKASALRKTHLVTFGGAYSNHLLATACAAAKYGFKSTGFVRGEAASNATLDICRLFGMELRFVSRDSYLDKHHLFNTYFSDHEDAFFIDEGGTSAEAVQGCAELIAELNEPYDHIFCAAGTGSTAAGLLKGIHDADHPATLHAVPVLKNGEFIGTAIEKLSGCNRKLVLHTAYHFGGYAKTTPHLLSFISRFASSTGILLDPVYTAKTVYAVYDLIGNGAVAPQSRVLVIHTGGLVGLLGKLG